ncbi:MAG TPA: F0F1 ATP synthase subunit A [Dermatophilaceae bacterium]|nr:F0F1 ATP synthase subunit A [Dermatophilaceae bacterium]
MSLTAPRSGLVSLPAAGGESFTPPTTADFYQPLIGDGPWAITRACIVALLSVALIGWLLVAGTRKAAVVPGRGQWYVEAGYNFVRNTIARDNIGSHDFMRFVPLLFTFFCLILVNNLFGIIPPVQFPTMSRIGFPIALTIVVYVIYHYLGIKKHGVAGYFKSLVPAGLPKAIVPYIFLLEFITFFVTRPLTLALRLFGNMFAGHMLLLLFILGGEYMLINGGIGLKVAGVGSFVMAFVLTLFEALVEFLQAYIFTLLAASYIAGALAEEH